MNSKRVFRYTQETIDITYHTTHNAMIWNGVFVPQAIENIILKHLDDGSGLKELHLVNAHMSNAVRNVVRQLRPKRLVPGIEKFVSLDTVSLENTRDEDNIRNNELLARLPPSVTCLDLAKLTLTNAGLAHIQNLRGLRELHVNAMNEDVALSLPAHIEILDLGDTWIADYKLHFLTCLSALRSLRINDNEDIDELSHIKAIRGIECLYLSNCYRLADSAFEGFDCLLTTLDISGTNTTDGAMQHIRNIGSLTSLNARDCPITSTGLVHIGGMAALEILDISRCVKVDDDGMESIARLPRLKSLDITSVILVTDDGMRHVGRITSLQTLKMSLNRKITDEGIQHLSHLVGLISLDLMFCNVSDSGLRHLPPSIERLYVSNITDAGIEILIRYPLKQLWISQCIVTEEGIRKLSTISTLERLGIASCPITYKCLLSLRGLASLRILDIRCRTVDRKSAKRLKKKMHRSLDVRWCWSYD